MASETALEERVLEVGEFYDLLTAHIEGDFGRRRPHWVRGEISKVYEKGHVYLDLVDATTIVSDAKRPTLNAHCWATPWAPLKRRLAQEGVTLAQGMVVRLWGYVDVYAPQGRLGFTVIDVDVADVIGDVARRRRELIARLDGEGLLARNKSRILAPVPLRVGVVASVGTEGYQDFVNQVSASPFRFSLLVANSLVQGEGAPAQIERALAALDGADLDVICLVRGGGSKGDLICFDDERVARAIASAATPVLTGIGHSGDESVADLVAYGRAITPTKLGEDLVSRVTTWHEDNVVAPSRRVLEMTVDVLDESRTFLDERRRTVVLALRDRLRGEARALEALRERLLAESRHVTSSAGEWLSAVRRLLGAYDPARRLAQGWSLVTDSSGEVVRAVSDVAVGDEVTVRLGDGAFGARVSEVRGVVP